MILFSLRTVLVRMSILFVWLSFIFLFLFSPRITKVFRTEKSIKIFTFPTLLDADYITAFERETGIKLYISYYENNDELLAKLRRTQGGGYDIVMPSDYAVELLIKEGLLKKIDTSKLHFFNSIDSQFLSLYFDPGNIYSIPYMWEFYTIGINTTFFKGNMPDFSWGLIFDKKMINYRVGMVNNAREAVLIAAYYLFGSIDNLTNNKIKQIKKLLIEQKKWVEAYTDLRSDYLLLSGSCPVAVGMSGEIWRASRFEKKIDFLIPQEGSFIVLDNIVLPKKRSNKEDLVYAFINYLYRPEVQAYHANALSLFPVIEDISLSDYFLNTKKKIKKIKKLEFFKNVLSEKQLHNIWITLKAN